MKNVILFLTVILCALQTTFGQVHQGNLVIDEQSDIDSFAYTTITGDLTIKEKSPGAISNLNNLSVLTLVNGYLTITENSTLQNLNGLSNLNVGDFTAITISKNPSLNTINGLSGITYISERLVIEDNITLDNLDGLANVTLLGDAEGYFSLRVRRNSNLTNACGIINIINYDPSYLTVASVIDNNGPNTSTLADIITNCQMPSCQGIYAGDLVLTSQEAINTFNYCEITGNLTVEETTTGNITDLTKLSMLEKLGGGLYIKNNAKITTIDAFMNLTAINGSLELANNADLLTIGGLSNIESISGNLAIRSNKKITSFSAFNNLTSLNGNLNIHWNEGLTNLDGFINLATINGFVEIKGNANMASVTGLNNLSMIGKELRIIGNGLINLNGLTNLTQINSSIELTNNFNLNNVDVFSNITSLKDLRIKNNNLTSLSGFSGLTTVERLILNNCDISNLNDLSNLIEVKKALYLYSNANLNDINGISNAIGSDLEILHVLNNDNLSNINGLENLNNVSVEVKIKNNEVLNNLNALSNLGTITKNLEVSFNPNLENACGILQLLINSTAVGGITTIENNGPDSSSEEGIKEFCSEDETVPPFVDGENSGKPVPRSLEQRLVVYPILNDGQSITINGVETTFTYSIYNFSGILLEQKTISEVVDNGTIVFDAILSQGNYILTVEEPGDTASRQFVVQ